MARIEVEYFEPEPRPESVKAVKAKPVPFGLRLTALRALLQEAFSHPNVTSYLKVDVENNKVIIQRERKKPNRGN